MCLEKVRVGFHTKTFFKILSCELSHRHPHFCMYCENIPVNRMFTCFNEMFPGGCSAAVSGFLISVFIVML